MKKNSYLNIFVRNRVKTKLINLKLEKKTVKIRIMALRSLPSGIFSEGHLVHDNEFNILERR
jgi:hypothetical protein